jgi:hypothetical protein
MVTDVKEEYFHMRSIPASRGHLAQVVLVAVDTSTQGAAKVIACNNALQWQRSHVEEVEEVEEAEEVRRSGKVPRAISAIALEENGHSAE